MSDLTPQLDRLGDAIEDAVAAHAEPARPARRRLRSRHVLIAVAALAIAIPGVAYAAVQLTSSEGVAASMPAGTLAMAGTEPSCTVVTEGVEYHCTLAKAPAPEVQDWKGTVEPTVGTDKRVNGGCRSLTSDGREWECYLGKTAVDQQIIGAGFLGESAPSPGQG
jgi:hypothetical protein